MRSPAGQAYSRSMKQNQYGFGVIPVVAIIALLVIIGLAAWRITAKKPTNNATTATSSQVTPPAASSDKPTASAATSKPDVQSDLNALDSSNAQANKDLTGTTNSLGDQSTFTDTSQ